MITGPEEFDHVHPDLLSALLGIKAEEKISDKVVSKSDIAKQAQLPNELFDYIHTAKC